VTRRAWFRPLLIAFVATRLVQLAAAEVAAWRIHSGRAFAHGWGAHVAHLTDTLASWDGQRYLQVADGWYPATLDERHGFFPLLPAILRGVDAVGLPAVAVTLALVNVAALGGLVCAALVTEHLYDERIATLTVVILCVFPLSYVLSMLYTESLAMLFGFGAVALVQRGRPWLAVPLAVLAGLTRSTALLLVLPLAGAALRDRRSSAVGRAAVVVAPVVGFGLFAAYLHARTGDALAFQHAQERFWRRRTGPRVLTSLWTDLRTTKHAWASPNPYLLVGYVALLVAFVRRIPVEWWLYALALVLIPASTGRLPGVGRYGLLALPVFWGLAFLAERAPLLYRAAWIVGPLLSTALIVFWLPQHTP
jgi:hypothetical protein